MPLGMNIQTDRQTHKQTDGRTDRQTHTPTCERKRIQESKCMQPSATHAWFKSNLYAFLSDKSLFTLLPFNIIIINCGSDYYTGLTYECLVLDSKLLTCIFCHWMGKRIW